MKHILCSGIWLLYILANQKVVFSNSPNHGTMSKIHNC